MAGGDSFPGGNPALDISNLKVAANALGNGNVAASLAATLATIAGAVAPIEGTWLPVVSLGATPVTSYTQQVGAYSKVGNRVFFSIRVVINAKGAGVGSVTISLPIAPSNVPANSYAAVALVVGTLVGFTTESFGGTVDVVNGRLVISFMTNGTSSGLLDTNIGVGSTFNISGQYTA